MKELDQVIQKRCFTYTQLKSSKRAYLYEQRDTETNQFFCHVIFERRESEGPQPEVLFPDSEAYGKWAFVLRSRDRAEQKYRELNAK